MTRVEMIGGATLYLGDCLAVMPGLNQPVDHVISDPPYEDELHAAVGKIRRTDGKPINTPLGFDGINASRGEVAQRCVAIAQGWLVLFTLAEGVRAWRDEIQAAGGKYDTCLAWIKPDASPRFNGQGPARGFECAVTAWCGKGYRRWNGGGKRGVYTHVVNGHRYGGHPTEKPVALMLELLRDFTMPEQTVLDPYMGSGTTGVAAIKSGRAFVGIESNPVHFDLACKRIAEAVSEPMLPGFGPRAAKQEAFL